MRANALLTLQLQTLVGNIAGFALVFHYVEKVAGLRSARHTKHLYRL